MSVEKVTKQARISIRLKRSSKRVLEHAASLRGESVSNFILDSALARAEKTIHEHQIISLNLRDADAFFDAMTKPMRFNKKLSAALKEHDQRVNK